jgi:hypothetical protein
MPGTLWETAEGGKLSAEGRSRESPAEHYASWLAPHCIDICIIISFSHIDNIVSKRYDVSFSRSHALRCSKPRPVRTACRRIGRQSQEALVDRMRELAAPAPPASKAVKMGALSVSCALSSLGGGKRNGRGAEGVSPSHREQGNGQHGKGFRANRQLAGRAERSAERTFEILAPRQSARALARRRPVRGDNDRNIDL